MQRAVKVSKTNNMGKLNASNFSRTCIMQKFENDERERERERERENAVSMKRTTIIPAAK